MKNQEKQYYIYLRSTRERVPCTKEEFDNYYRDINAFRQKQQYHGRCVCPKGKYLDCDMDCFTCPFSRAGDKRSLDYTVTDEVGNEISWVDMLEDPTIPFEDNVVDSHQLRVILDRIVELMPQAIEIGQYRLAGFNECQIEKILKINHMTYRYRLKKLKKVLEEEFSEIF